MLITFKKAWQKIKTTFSLKQFDEAQFGEQGAREVRKMQVEAVYSLTNAMMFGNIIFASLLTINLLGHSTLLDLTILTWLCVLTSISLFTLNKSQKRKKSGKTYSGSKKSVNNLVISSGILATLWCVPVVVFYGLSEGLERGVMTAIMAGILSAGAASLSRLPKAAILWLVTAGIIHAIVSLIAGIKSGEMADYTIFIFAIFATLGLVASVYDRARAFMQGFAKTQDIKEKSEVIDLLLKDYEDQATEWLWETDENGKAIRVPSQILDMLGFEEETLKAHTCPQLARQTATPESHANLNRLMDSLSRLEEFHDITLSVKDVRDGSTRWIMTRGKPQWDGDKFLGYRGICADATAAMEAEKNIHYLAKHDALTGLANRTTFNDQIKRWNTAKREFCILLIDLDYFKAVNDTFGHGIGDTVLKEVSKRLKQAAEDAGLRRWEECTIARFGGDEFSITFVADRRGEAKDIRETCKLLADRIVELIAEPFMHENENIQIGASVGYVIAPDDGDEVSRLVNRADTAMYRAKANGKSTNERFDFAMDEDKRSARILELDVRNALKNGEFRIAYQPIVSVDFDENGKMNSSKKAGMEALIRWEHPEKGIIGPDLFIPIAEESGSIIAIGEWVLKQACNEAASWDDESSIAVNVSVKQIIAPNFMHTVLGALASSGLPPQRLEIEMTESVLITDPELTISTIQQLRRLGVRVSLDDFGTGYSSLSYIADFDVDRIKIDKSFVDKLGDDSTNAGPVIQAITSLAKSLGLATVGEGVETKEQAEMLTKLGCNHLQGYFYGRPEIRESIRAATSSISDYLEEAEPPSEKQAITPVKKTG